MICKKRNTLQKICMAGIVMGVFLLLAGCGDDSGADGGVIEIWDGAQADLNRGQRPKEAVYHYENLAWIISYDAECNVIGVRSEKEGNGKYQYGSSSSMPDAVEKVLDSDGCYYMYEPDDIAHKKFFTGDPTGCDWNISARTITYEGGSVNTFSKDGYLLRSEYSVGESSEITRYSYDKNGRLIKCENDRYSYSYSYENENDFLLSFQKRNDYYGIYTYTYKREYDENGNVIRLQCYSREEGAETELISISEWEYDEAGNMLSSKSTSGHRSGSEEYYESHSIRQYDETGNLTENITQISIGGKEYTVSKTEYLYDEDGRVTESNTYNLRGQSKTYLDEQADWCKTGGNTELYITEKREYQYDGNYVNTTQTFYFYEANKDFSVVNLLEDETYAYISRTTAGYWTITYYTDEEIEQYLHDQEFSPVK